MAKVPAVGIDLGTTRSCVAAVLPNGIVKVIHNEHGKNTTPSYVAFVDADMLVGEDAQKQAHLNPANTIFDAKRMIGRSFDDAGIQADMKVWPFKVVKDGQKPKIKVNQEGKEKLYDPENISAIVLKAMKTFAEDVLEGKVEDAVITVPARFSNSQREATKQAAKEAGLNVLQIINEPTAAAIAYGFDKKSDDSKKILVYDFGGGTLDVSVVSVSGPHIQVLGTAGNAHLGGRDLDSRMVEHFLREIKADIRNNSRAISRLREACEEAKCTLSNRDYANIDLVVFYDGKDFQSSIKQTTFNEINIDLFEATIKVVEKCLNDLRLKAADIDEVVLAGGCSRIPKVQELLSEFFGGKKLNKSVHPDEAVAYGAAVKAAYLQGNPSEHIRQLVVKDIIPLSLGCSSAVDTMVVFIAKNETIPNRVIRDNWITSKDNQTSIKFSVYEGERYLVKHNNLLGTFTLTGLPAKKKGEVKIEVTFEIDDNGILKVSAAEKFGSTAGNMIRINKDLGGLKTREVDDMLENAERYLEEDRVYRERNEVRKELTNYAYKVKHFLENQTQQRGISYSRRNGIIDKCGQLIRWISDNQHERNKATKAEFEAALQELKAMCQPLGKLD